MKMKHSRIIISSILAVASLTACGKSPESTVESFYRAMGKGEVTEAKTYLSSEMINTLGDAKLSRVISSESARISECGGIKKVETDLKGEGEVRSGTAVVSYVADKCKAKSFKTKMVKEDGKWKITISK